MGKKNKPAVSTVRQNYESYDLYLFGNALSSLPKPHKAASFTLGKGILQFFRKTPFTRCCAFILPSR